ncbi:MAG: hypothetical protein ACFFBD_10910 [Candidatus Hodarchaeota archaeon]
MLAKHKRRIRRNPQMTNHSQFKYLHKRWLKQIHLNELECFSTKHFDPRDFIKPLELASIENTSITDACSYYRVQGQHIPSAELVLKQVREIQPEVMDIYVNQVLRHQFYTLPREHRKYLKRSGVLIVDFHEDPYYGDRKNPEVIRRRLKQSTKHFYSYLTADLYSPRGMQTIAVRFQRPGETISGLFWDLMAWVEMILTPKLILMDGEFSNVLVMVPLLQDRIVFITRKDVSYRMRALALTYELTDNWAQYRRFHAVTIREKQRRYHEITIHVTFHLVKGKMKALAIPPFLQITPEEAVRMYKHRFAIETGYRDKHLFQARTTSKHRSIRLMIFLFAISLWNLWQSFLLAVFPRTNRPLSRFACWRRQTRVIKRFLKRDELL